MERTGQLRTRHAPEHDELPPEKEVTVPMMGGEYPDANSSLAMLPMLRVHEAECEGPSEHSPKLGWCGHSRQPSRAGLEAPSHSLIILAADQEQERLVRSPTMLDSPRDSRELLDALSHKTDFWSSERTQNTETSANDRTSDLAHGGFASSLVQSLSGTPELPGLGQTGSLHVIGAEVSPATAQRRVNEDLRNLTPMTGIPQTNLGRVRRWFPGVGWSEKSLGHRTRAAAHPTLSKRMETPQDWRWFARKTPQVHGLRYPVNTLAQTVPAAGMIRRR